MDKETPSAQSHTARACVSLKHRLNIRMAYNSRDPGRIPVAAVFGGRGTCPAISAVVGVVVVRGGRKVEFGLQPASSSFVRDDDL